MTGLPAALSSRLDALLEGVSRRDLEAKAKSLSARYRATAGSHAVASETLAYAVTRLPATYAAVHAVLTEAAARLPGFAPGSLLDLGAGPGTAAWAAAETFPSLDSALLIEREAAFRRLGASLAQDAPHPALAGAEWRAGDLEAPGAVAGRFDLVVASFSLAEIAPVRLASLAAAAWNATAGALVLVEPGTPAGSARILAARDHVLALGGHVAAPCPAGIACPVPENDWCHFAVRLPRRRDHRLAKGADAPFEDEKYPYAVLARDPAAPAQARILRPPSADKTGLRATLCTPEGLRQAAVPARDRDRFKEARRWRWGDGLDGSGSSADS